MGIDGSIELGPAAAAMLVPMPMPPAAPSTSDLPQEPSTIKTKRRREGGWVKLKGETNNEKQASKRRECWLGWLLNKQQNAKERSLDWNDLICLFCYKKEESRRGGGGRFAL